MVPSKIVVVAGANGELGQKLVKSLVNRGATVKAIIRPGNTVTSLNNLKTLGVEVFELDYDSQQDLEKACSGANCIVSALSGLRDTIITTQTKLLEAAINSGVPRFIPSDYSIDFTRTVPGDNRNLDLRREFYEQISKAPINATSIFNGAFTGLLCGKAPIILFKWQRILYWQDPDQKMDFTTMADTAEFTAAVAVDSSPPRDLHIAGDSLSPRELAQVLSDITGKEFKLLRAGSLKTLSAIIKITKIIMPADQNLYPVWQGMQYLRDMASCLTRVDILDNDRYQSMNWQSVRDVLTEYIRHLGMT